VISIIPKNIDIPIYRKFQYRVIGIYKNPIIIGISIYRNSLGDTLPLIWKRRHLTIIQNEVEHDIQDVAIGMQGCNTPPPPPIHHGLGKLFSKPKIFEWPPPLSQQFWGEILISDWNVGKWAPPPLLYPLRYGPDDMKNNQARSLCLERQCASRKTTKMKLNIFLCFSHLKPRAPHPRDIAGNLTLTKC
jgi:hypothetical protein